MQLHHPDIVISSLLNRALNDTSTYPKQKYCLLNNLQKFQAYYRAPGNADTHAALREIVFIPVAANDN